MVSKFKRHRAAQCERVHTYPVPGFTPPLRFRPCAGVSGRIQAGGPLAGPPSFCLLQTHLLAPPRQRENRLARAREATPAFQRLGSSWLAIKGRLSCRAHPRDSPRPCCEDLHTTGLPDGAMSSLGNLTGPDWQPPCPSPPPSRHPVQPAPCLEGPPGDLLMLGLQAGETVQATHPACCWPPVFRPPGPRRYPQS